MATYLNTLASLILAPSSYETGKLYSLKPDTGLGDLTVARNSEATRIGPDGELQTMGIDVPRINYPSCPSYLLEPSRVNLFLNSDVGATQTITVVSGQTYSFYFFEGDGSIDLTGAHTATVTASDHSYSNAVTFTAGSTSLVCTVTGEANQVQCEAGTYPTTYIPTQLATVTRSVEQCVVQDLQTNGILGATEGTCLIEMDFAQLTTARETSNREFVLGTWGVAAIVIYRNLATVINPVLAIRDTVLISSTEITESSFKLAFKWDGANFKAYMNGVLFMESAYTETVFDDVTFDGSPSAFQVGEVQMYPTALTDEQLIELTT